MSQIVKHIQSDAELQQVCEQFQQAQVLAFDTEFIRRNTYFPKLALLQLASDSTVALIDPLQITHWQPLLDILSNENITKLMHACWEDLEVCHYSLNVLPKNIVDTQLAAAFAGYDWGMGYHRMVSNILGVDLNKTETLTNWLQRPLTEKQMQYAVEDVTYLLQVWEKISVELEEKNVTSWLTQQCAALMQKFVDTTDTSKYYLRAKSVSNLSHRQQFLFAKLSEWRENKAQQKNLPRSWLVPDKVLQDIVKRQPNDEEALLACVKKDRKKVQPFAKKLLEVLQSAMNEEQAAWPPRLEKAVRLPKGHGALAWRDHLDELAKTLAIPAQLLLSKDEFFSMLFVSEEGVIQAQIPEHWSEWKKEAVGKPMQSFINGLHEQKPSSE